MNSLDFASFKKCFIELSNEVAPLKTKLLRANHSKFFTKVVSKAWEMRNQFFEEEYFRGKN